MSYNQYGQYTGDAYGHSYTRPAQPASNVSTPSYQYPSEYNQNQYGQASAPLPSPQYIPNSQHQYMQANPQTNSMTQSYVQSQPHTVPSPSYTQGYSQYYTQPQTQTQQQAQVQHNSNHGQHASAQRIPSHNQYGAHTSSSYGPPSQMSSGYYGAPSSTNYSSWHPPASAGSMNYGSTTNADQLPRIGEVDSLDNNITDGNRYNTRTESYQSLGRGGTTIAASPIQQTSALPSPLAYSYQAITQPSPRQSSANVTIQSPQVRQSSQIRQSPQIQQSTQLPPPRATHNTLPAPVATTGPIASPIAHSSGAPPGHQPSSSTRVQVQAGSLVAQKHPQHNSPAIPPSHPIPSPQTSSINSTSPYAPPLKTPMASRKSETVKLAKHVELPNQAVHTTAPVSLPPPVKSQPKVYKPKVLPEKHLVQQMKPANTPNSRASLSEQTKSSTKTAPSPTISKADDVAYDSLLISLSAEYIEAAHQLGPRVGLLADPDDVDTYNGLIAAGLSCLEAALNHFNFPPRLEAAITFRYATLLYEETENFEQLERILSKSIMKCDRNKLFDFKYSTYHLLARTTYRRNPKAALKALDTHIHEVEGVDNVPWIYALRLLRVTLLLRSASNHDLAIALQDLKALVDVANKQRDFGMIVAFATLEALVHLRTDSPHMILNCQESIATARSLQNRKGAEDLKQILVILSCVDLACSLIQCNVNQVRENIKAVQELIEKQVVDQGTWAEDGSIGLAMSQETTNKLSDFASGIFRLNENGQAVLSIHWFDRPGAYAFGFLLGACTELVKDSIGEKSSKYVQGGLEVINAELMGENRFNVSPTSRWDVDCRSQRNVPLQWYLQLYQTFLCCVKTDWTQARSLLSELNNKIQIWDFANATKLQRWTIYLSGIIEQGSGNLEAAAQIYRSPILMNSPQIGSTKVQQASNSHDDLALLSRINLLFILRSADRAPSGEALQLISELGPSSHGIPFLKASIALITAMINPREALTRTKAALRDALTISRSANATQTLVISMTAMVSMFFNEITDGQQAKQGRSVAVDLAKKLGNSVWIAVAQGIALQGELDPVMLQERHDALDKLIENMDGNTKAMLLNSQGDVMDES